MKALNKPSCKFPRPKGKSWLQSRSITLRAETEVGLQKLWSLSWPSDLQHWCERLTLRHSLIHGSSLAIFSLGEEITMTTFCIQLLTRSHNKPHMYCLHIKMQFHQKVWHAVLCIFLQFYDNQPLSSLETVFCSAYVFWRLPGMVSKYLTFQFG